MFMLAQYNGGFQPYEGTNYTVFCLFIMIIFVIAYQQATGWAGWFSALDDPVEEDIDVEFHSYGDDPMTEEDWNTICRTAIEEAKAGSAAARTWVTKNIVENNVATPEPPKPCRSKSKPKRKSYNETPSDVANDAVSALRNAGHTKADAVKRVKECIKEKTYDKVEDLISDAFAK